LHHGEFAATVDDHYSGLVQRLTLVLHDAEEARDVAQEAYLRAFRAWDRFDGADARAWLHTIGLRLAFNALRRRRLWQAWRTSQPTDALWVQPEHLDLWHALDRLRPEQRAALLLNVMDGYTQAEIAQILASPEGTVAGWVAGAKAQLRDVLGQEGDA
jgi:RNA polymerase sigma-70 factor (ECF subfamily)